MMLIHCRVQKNEMDDVGSEDERYTSTREYKACSTEEIFFQDFEEIAYQNITNVIRK